MRVRRSIVLAILTLTAGVAVSQSRSVRTVFVHSDPMFAAILVDGQPVSELTPARLDLPDGTATIAIEVVLEGYRPHGMSVAADGDHAAFDIQLVPERSTIYIDAAGLLETPGAVVSGNDGALQITDGLYSVTQRDGTVAVERSYPRDGVRRLLGWAIPVFSFFTAAAAWEDLNDTRGNLTFSAGTLAGATFTLAAAAGYVGITIDRARTHDPSVALIDRDTTSRAADELALLADRDFRVGAFDDARQRYEELVSTHPRSGHVPAALVRLADIHRLARRTETAEALYRAVVNNYPAPDSYNAALLSLSEMALSAGRTDAALDLIDRSVVGIGGIAEDQLLQQRAAVLQRVLLDDPSDDASRRRLVEVFERLVEIVPEGIERQGYMLALESLLEAGDRR